MSLAPGLRVGPYEVTAKVGVGGMGEVWRATDTNLGRQVAIKVLPDAFAQDAERVARFEREAKTLAALNHPNIASIYGIEKIESSASSGQGAARALVMEFLDGPTLADRIASGPVPLDEALAIARQIGDALEVAHERGIVHRDVKPANIKLKDDGSVKVLDFGLAKALEPAQGSGLPPSPRASAGQAKGHGDLTNSPTLTSPAMTAAGMILGTAAYMSPEQARGRPVDKRTDIWAFGCVLYEMVTGRRAFEGEDVTETLAAIVKSEPNLARVPEPVRRLIASCLDKNPKSRLRDVGDAWRLVEPPSSPSTSRWLPAAAVAALGVILVLGLMLVSARQPASAPVPPAPARFVHALGEREKFTVFFQTLAISRDGRMIAYTANRQLLIRRLDELEARPVKAAAGLVAYEPFFSPDGRWIAFLSGRDQTLVKTPVDGGPAVVICKVPIEAFQGADWGSNGQIVYSVGDAIVSVSADGGTPATLLNGSKEELLDRPHVLPDARTVLYTAISDLGSASVLADARVMAVTAGGQPRMVVRGAFDARYVNSGHVIYSVGPSVMAAAFDTATVSVTGDPRVVLEQVRRGAGRFSATTHLAVSDSGTLASEVPFTEMRQPRTLVWVNRAGREEPIPAAPRPYANVRVSPDGRQIALSIRDGGIDIWIWDIASSRLWQLTSDRGAESVPAWFPDGKRLAFSRTVGSSPQVHWQPSDGSGSPEPVDTNTQEPRFPLEILRDDRILYGSGIDNVGVLSAGERRLLLATPAFEWNADVSPNQRFLAFQSDRTGQFEIYVRLLDDVNAGEWPVSSQGGVSPRWSADGRELFYWRDNGSNVSIMSVRVADAPTFQMEGPAQELFSGSFEGPGWDAYYDVAPDGRFLMMKAHGTPPRQQIMVMTNWTDELRRLMGPK